MVTQALGRHIEGIALQADWAAVIYGQKWSSCRGNRETGSQGPLPEVRLTEPGASKTLTAKTRSWMFSRRRWGTMDRLKVRGRHGPFMATPGLEPSPGSQGPCWWAMSSLWWSTKSKASGHLFYAPPYTLCQDLPGTETRSGSCPSLPAKV